MTFQHFPLSIFKLKMIVGGISITINQIYFLYPERFPFLIFRLIKKLSFELNEVWSRCDLLPIEPSLLPFFDLLLNWNLELG